MPRKRNPENRGLPARWQLIHGAYYYQVLPGLEAQWDGKTKFRLGGTLPEAYKSWAARLEQAGNAETVGQLLDRYALEVVPMKSARQQLDQNRYAGRMRAVFGELLPTDIRPQLVYQFLERSPKKVAARRAIALLSHAFTETKVKKSFTDHDLRAKCATDAETFEQTRALLAHADICGRS